MNHFPLLPMLHRMIGILLCMGLIACSSSKPTNIVKQSTTTNTTNSIVTTYSQEVTETKDFIRMEEIQLPESKISLDNIRKGNIHQSEDSTIDSDYPADQYGKFFHDFRDIPIYDINNLPISVWFIKSNNKYVGFIVAGHATEAVCKVASLEVHNNVKKLGDKEDAIFSFGLGYDMLDDPADGFRYDGLLRKMQKELQDLQLKNPDQVSVGEIDQQKYLEYLDLFKQHIQLAQKSTDWDTHIVEYKLTNFPLISPFYQVDNAKPISFKVPKSLFGKIPTELVYATYEQSLVEVEKSLIQTTNTNQKEIERVAKFKNSETSIPLWDIQYYSFQDNALYTHKEKLRGYLPPPDGYEICEGQGFARRNCQPITFRQAIEYLKDPAIVANSPKSVIEGLKKWQKIAAEDIKSFQSRKQAILSKIKQANQTIKDYLVIVKHRREELNQRDNQDYIIDAYLRGWVFGTGDAEMDKRLDIWYEGRNTVWQQLMKQYPKAKVDGKLAGIFQSDDVFFKVLSGSNNFIITPYKVVGGEFIQVIDKQMNISYLQSPFNYRLTLK